MAEKKTIKSKEGSYLSSDDGVYSAFKFAHHEDRVSSLEFKSRDAPVCLQLDLMSICNHNCAFCAYRNAGFETPHKGGHMDFDEKRNLDRETGLRVIRQASECGVKSIEFTGGGEPTLAPYFKEALQVASESGLEIAVVTNGERFSPDVIDSLDPEKIKWIRFSMDSCTPETHQKVHYTALGQFPRKARNKFDSIVDNITYCVSQKGGWNEEAKIGISYVIVPENLHEILEATEFYKGLGVDNIRFSFEYDIHYDGRLTDEQKEQVYADLELAKDLFDEERFRVFGWKSRLEEYNAENDFGMCGYQYGTMQVGADGGVWPCCITKYYPEHMIGNIHEKSLGEILYGDDRKVDFDVRGCPPCWLKPKNEFNNAVAAGEVESVLSPIQFKQFEEYMEKEDPPHVNFP